MRIIALSIALGIVGLSPLHAQNVQEIRPGCRMASGGTGSSKLIGDAEFCLRLAAGISAVLAMNCWELENGFSPSSALTAGQPPSYGAAVQAFMNWSDKNPDKWGWHSSLGMAAAIREAFPCY